MLIERVKNEIIIKIPEPFDVEIVQQFIDYINFKSLQVKSKASDEDIDKLSNEINKSWIEKHFKN